MCRFKYIFKMINKLLFSFFLFSMMPVIAVCQYKPLPKWATTNPISTATITRAVASGSTLEEARHNAVNILVSQKTSGRSEEGSYQYSLIEKGQAPVEQHSSLVKIAENSAFFKSVKTHVTDDQSYIYCEISEHDYRLFCDSVYSAIVVLVDSMATRAEELKRTGELFNAAEVYCHALQNLVPILHKQIVYHDFDLVEVLHQGYLHSMDSIYWTFEKKSCPMVPGEDVPVEIFAKATYNGQPVQGLPVSFTVSDGGKVNHVKMTNAEGIAKLHVTEAPKTDKAIVTVSLNKQSLLDLPKHIFSGELPLRLMEQLHTAQMSLFSFDPTPFYYLNLSDDDFKFIGDTLSSIMDANGYKRVTDKKNSDIEIDVSCDILADGTPTQGKYPMQYYSSSMVVTVKDHRSLALLEKDEKKDMRLFVPDNVDSALLRKNAMLLNLRRMKTGLNNKVSKMNYDKRKVIYSL